MRSVVCLLEWELVSVRQRTAGGRGRRDGPGRVGHAAGAGAATLALGSDPADR